MQLMQLRRAGMQTHKPIAERGATGGEREVRSHTCARIQRPTHALRMHGTRCADSPGSQKSRQEGAVAREVRLASGHVVAARMRDDVPAVRREQAGQRLTFGDSDLRGRSRSATVGYLSIWSVYGRSFALGKGRVG